MIINVSDLIKAPTGTSRVVAIHDRLVLDDPELTLLEAMKGDLRFVRDHAGILVEGVLKARVELPCARCLVPSEHMVDVEIAEHFRPTVAIPGGSPILRDPEEEDDPATRINSRHELDLSEVVAQQLLTSVPLNPLCRDDCRGLCAQCGAALNEGPCSCEPATDARWDALRVLIDDSERSAG